MGVTDAPQWLLSAFVRSAVAVGANAPREQIEDCARRVAARWQEPERSFHNLRHLIDVLARVDEIAEETHNPELVRLAAWYHGAVFSSAAANAYARRGGEDEEASAELASAELRGLGVPERVADRVSTLIRNLKRHDADPSDVDSLALSDADLATLAVEPQRYAAYRAAVRDEYAHLPLRDYLEARIVIITKLLSRRRLYCSPFGASWEDPARENLSAELQRLRAELAAMPAPDDDGTAGRAADAPREAAGRATDAPREAAGRATDAPRETAGRVTDARHGLADPAPADGMGPGRVPSPRTDPVERRGRAAAAAASAPTPSEAFTDEDAILEAPVGTLDRGIERGPEPLRRPRFRGAERRGRRGRREEKAAGSRTTAPDEQDSTGSLFRPPPGLPRS